MNNATNLPLLSRSGSVAANAIVDESRLESILARGKWRLGNNGYVTSTQYVDGVRSDLYLHRFLMNPGADMVVDHINGNPLDNRIENLRVLTRAQNMQNRKGPTRSSTTGIRNVHFAPSGSPGYRVRVAGKFLGNFMDIEEAARVAEAARPIILPFSR